MTWSPRTWVGRRLARLLSKPIRGYKRFDASDPSSYHAFLRPGDLLLVEGDTRFSVIVKYLTQSTWSHVAMYVGAWPEGGEASGEPDCLVEADINRGVIAVPLGKYTGYNVRVCRPVGLDETETARVVRYMTDRLGMRYDLKNVTDLLRYFLPKPWFFSRDRRRYLELGSGDPTRAICSSIIARAFQEIGYPIMPRRGMDCAEGGDGEEVDWVCRRHHSLFAPRDFDLSPYFEVVKPTLLGFSHRDFAWKEPDPGRESGDPAVDAGTANADNPPGVGAPSRPAEDRS